MREIGLALVLMGLFLPCGLYYLFQGELLTGIGWMVMSLTGVVALGFVIWQKLTEKEYSEIPATIRNTATLGPLGVGALLIIIDGLSLLFN